MIILNVNKVAKNYGFGDVLKEISPFITSNKLIVSIAAGVRTEKLETNLPSKTRVIRVMPNTPLLLGVGATAISRNPHVSDKTYSKFFLILLHQFSVHNLTRLSPILYINDLLCLFYMQHNLN